jgi:hypothetical protein
VVVPSSALNYIWRRALLGHRRGDVVVNSAIAASAICASGTHHPHELRARTC